MGPFLGFLAGFLIFARLCAAAGAAEAATELARRIATRLRPQETVRLEVRSLALPEDRKTVEAALAQVLRSRLRPGDQSPLVRVTISRGSDSPLLVAEISRPEGTTVMMAPYDVARPEAARFELALEKRVIWRQADRLLDVAMVEGGMVVLDENRLALVRESPGAGEVSSPIPHDQPWPRDLRGRVAAREGGFEAWVPGTYCVGKVRPEWHVECAAQDRPWPLGSAGEATAVAGRNHFLHARFGTVFSVAVLGEAAVVAMPEGGVILQRPPAAPVAAPGLGSDVSTLPDPCAQGDLLLGSNTEGSTLTLYRVGAQGLAAVSQPLELEGSLTALWGETAIVKSGANGGYAAYRVSAVCRR